MSRIGLKPVAVPAGVKVTVDGREVAVVGPLGSLSLVLPESIAAEFSDGKINFSRENDIRLTKSLHGLARSLTDNMVVGVTKGYSKELEIQGVGYKAALQGQQLSLSLGLAGPVVFTVPKEVKVVVQDGTKIVVSGTDRQLVGQVAARIRAFHPPDPYKGKGIRYKDERVRKKVGKTVA